VRTVSPRCDAGLQHTQVPPSSAPARCIAKSARQSRRRRRVQTRRSACKFKRRRCLQVQKASAHLSVGGVHACPESSALGAVVALVNLCCEAHLLSRHAHSHHLRVLTASSPLSFDIVTCATRARKKTPEANTLRHSSCSRCCARARCVGRSDLTCTHIAHPSSRCACSPCPSMF
jgi:hypothetical protein